MTQTLVRPERPREDPVATSSARSAAVPGVVLAGRDLHGLLPAGDVTVLAKVDSGPEAERLALALRPDVVVLDPRVCGPRGETIRRIRQAGCAVLVVHTTADENALLTAIRAGALGFVTADVTEGELVHTIRVLAGGSALFGAGVAGPLLSRLSGGRPSVELTHREREVLDLLTAGHSHRAIAARLNLAQKTVRNTVSSINAKQRAGQSRGP